MSKAMDALEYIKQRIAWCPEHEKCPSCRDTESNLAALRDYITTTEAADVKGVRDIIPEMENALDTALHFKANDTHNDTIQAYEAWREKTLSMVNWSLCLLAENQRQLGRDESAARIKELEEALYEIAGPINHDATMPGDTRIQRIARASLDGARKVGA